MVTDDPFVVIIPILREVSRIELPDGCNCRDSPSKTNLGIRQSFGEISANLYALSLLLERIQSALIIALTSDVIG